MSSSCWWKALRLSGAQQNITDLSSKSSAGLLQLQKGYCKTPLSKLINMLWNAFFLDSVGRVMYGRHHSASTFPLQWLDRPGKKPTVG